MKKLELNQMENLEGGGSCQRFLVSHSDLSASDACVICSAAGGAAAGSIFGGPAGFLTGWVGGAVSGLFTC